MRRRLENSVLTLGTFDGVHRGHQKIIRTTKDKAKRSGRPSVVVTFEPLPRIVLGKGKEKLGLLTTLKQKEEIIKHLGIDALVILNFNHRLARIDPEEFVKRVICKGIGAGRVVVGPDFRFGKNRSGNVELLKRLGRKYGFTVTVVGEVRIDNLRVSSSKIRQLLWQGKIEQANHLLGRHYSIEGIVVRGKKRGKELSFPTANLDVSRDVILPPGVYAVLVRLRGKNYRGVANIGTRPTFSPFKKYTRPIAEVHILDFNRNLYRQKLELSLVKRIRKEMRFPSPGKLTDQIKRDIQYARKVCFSGS